MQPTSIVFSTEEWPEKTASIIHKKIRAYLDLNGTCSVILTGGRSAERLYNAWAAIPGFQEMAGVHFYFGDERCVPPDHPESNYGMTMRSLFRQGIPPGCAVFRMEAEAVDREDAASRYAEVLPEQIDVLLLGVGEDGHIASLFPGDAAIRETNRRVMPVVGPKPPNERITITPVVVARADSSFVLANGLEKTGVLHKALENPEDFFDYPARLVLNATWLLDTIQPAAIKQ